MTTSRRGLAIVVACLALRAADRPAVGADAALPEGATLRIGDPNALRTTVAGSYTFAPDGKTLYIQEQRDALRPWNLADGSRGKLVRGPAPFAILAISPDGKWIAHREQFNTVRLWNVASGAKERLWTTAGQAGSLVFSADSRSLVGSHEAKEFGKPSAITVWDVAADAPKRTFVVGTGKDPRVASFVVSPDGKRVAVTGSDVGPIRVFSLETGKETAAVGRSDWTRPQSVCFTGNDKLLVAFGNDLSAFDLAKPDAKPTVTTFPRNIEALSPDGSRVALSTPTFARFEIWDVATMKAGKTVGIEAAKSYAGHRFSPDGRWFAVAPGGNGGDPLPPRIWDAATGTERFANPGHPAAVLSLAVVDQGKTLVSAATDGRVRFWDLATGAAKKPFDLPGVHLQLSADGSRLLAAASGGVSSYSGVKVYETATRKLLAEYAENGTAVALSPDGNRVAVHKSGHIRVFDIDGEKLVADEAFEPELGFARSLAFGPDGKKLVAQPHNGLMLFDALAKEKPKPIYLDSSGFVPSPDGKFLAAIRAKPARVAIIDVAKGEEIAKFETKSPTAIAWSLDGKRVGTADGLTLHVWSAKTGKPILRRIGHDDHIQAIAFTPDGKAVITGGKDNLVYAWTLPESEGK